MQNTKDPKEWKPPSNNSIISEETTVSNEVKNNLYMLSNILKNRNKILFRVRCYNGSLQNQRSFMH